MKKVFNNVVIACLIGLTLSNCSKNDMDIESNVPVYNVLMVFVDEIQATFPTGAISHKMTANEKQICEMLTSKLSKWYNDAFNGSVKFKFDTYYTKNVINEKNFGTGILFYTGIPELEQIAKKYRAVATTYSVGYTGAHQYLYLPCSAGNALQVWLQYRLFKDTPVNQLDEDWWEETIYLYTHEMMHIFESGACAFDYHYALNMATPNQLNNLPFGPKRVNLINKLFMLNNLEVYTENGTEIVGIIFDFWKGDKLFTKVEYVYEYLIDIKTSDKCGLNKPIFETIFIDRLYQVETGSKLKEPKSPVRSGYRFDGWFKDDLFKVPWNFNTDRIENVLKLYAKMTLVDPSVKKYAVCFDTWYYSDIWIPAILEIDKGTKIAEPIVGYRNGFDFAGWYKDCSFTNPWNWDIDTVTEDIMLKGKWIPNGK